MKKRFFRLLSLVLLGAVLLPLPLSAAAADRASYYPDLSNLMASGKRRDYVETMIGYYLRNNQSVRKSLSEGYSAVFFFEGASDHMDDPVLSDISYYRVSAVCVVIRLGETGKLQVSYFNDDCSTLPDRPLEYGAWNIDGVGEVGPATICDGTYEVYSVKHGGKYEALHIRTDGEDDTLPAVYMNPEGYVTSRADMINIHTRNVNHTIEGAMWSAGCLLIGDGNFDAFTELISSTYYAVYNDFQIGERMGTVTVDRQLLKNEMYALYENKNAVDTLLAYSRKSLPEVYFRQCGKLEGKEQTLWAGKDMEVMSLPCSNFTDARSVAIARIGAGEKLDITGSIENSAGHVWYQVSKDGVSGYVFGGYCLEMGWWERTVKQLLG